jgi:hypothetical protein
VQGSNHLEITITNDDIKMESHEIGSEYEEEIYVSRYLLIAGFCKE